MQSMKVSALATIAVLALASCGGRVAVPVAVVQPMDNQLTCEQIQAEMAGNEGRIVALHHEERRAQGANVAIGAVGVLLFWPALFALDVSKAEQTEIAALRQRSSMLAMSMPQRCSEAGTSAPAGSAQERLNQLDRLRDRGAISEREYRSQRQEILRSI
jgi:hypothetical protein